MAKTSNNASQSTTQEFLEVYDITNNLVIMKDGTVSVVLTVSAINFGLLAEEEQDAVMYAYAGLLNSLNFPIQIVIHSQTKDVTKYLSLLKDQEDAAASTLIRKRISQYREFVTNLIQERNVLDKKFFVVIPASGVELGFATAKGLLPGQVSADITGIERSVIVEKAKNVLDPRRDQLIAQFARIGLYARELETQEIIQLFYVRYNPEATEGQQIEESSSYTSPLVTAQIHKSLFDQATVAPTQPSEEQLLNPTDSTPPPDLLEQNPAEEVAADQALPPDQVPQFEQAPVSPPEISFVEEPTPEVIPEPPTPNQPLMQYEPLSPAEDTQQVEPLPPMPPEATADSELPTPVQL